MRRRVLVLLGLVLALGVGVSQGEWQVKIHRGGTVHAWPAASIDSITFVDDTLSAPGLVPAGVFIMGSPTNELCRSSNETQHQVTLTRGFYVGVTEVTQAQWLATMGWNPSYFSGPDRPVEEITWFDAVSYCNQKSVAEGFTPVYTISNPGYQGVHITSGTVTWNQSANGYRLLTEAEWEYACRATSTTAFCNGGISQCTCGFEPYLGLVGWYCGNAGSQTHDVAQLAPNAWGLYDMHGNVFEWCWDWYGSYGGPVIDPAGPGSGAYRVLRGGSWSDYSQYCRSADRRYNSPSYRVYYLGLRLARTAF